MKEHIKGAINDFPEDIMWNATTPAKRNLFDADEGAERLSEERADIFHSIVAKLYCISAIEHKDRYHPSCRIPVH